MPHLVDAGRGAAVVRHRIPTIPEHPLDLIGGAIVQYGKYNGRRYERYWLVVAVSAEADKIWLRHFTDIPVQGTWTMPAELAPEPKTTIRLSTLAPAVRIGTVRFEGRVCA